MTTAVPQNLRQRMVILIQYNIEKTKLQGRWKTSIVNRTLRNINSQLEKKRANTYQQNRINASPHTLFHIAAKTPLNNNKKIIKIKRYTSANQTSRGKTKELQTRKSNLITKQLYNMASNYTCFLLKSITGKLNTLQLLQPIFLTSCSTNTCIKFQF